MSKQFVRSIKNITNRYTPVQIQVRNATSNDSWGPSSGELHEIALLTYHEVYSVEVLEVLGKRLADKPKNWRHIMKALTILLHCVYEGSDATVSWLKSHTFLVKSLREFRYADERNIDQGGPIRIKAQTLIAMMESPEKMESEKHKYHQIRAQMGRPGIVDMNGGDTPSDFRKVSHRMTFDIQPRTGGSASASSLSSNGTGAPAGGKGNLASPRSSFDNNRKQVTPRAPSFSLEGRYSLSLPLQSIQE